MTAPTIDLPTGTVTFFFSDVQDSTGLLQRLAGGYKTVIERHAEIIRGCLTPHRGVEISTEGDSFFAVFTEAGHAVEAARTIQQRLAAEPWPAGGTVAVRIGLHTGTAELGHDNYIGIDVNRAARISAAAHGGQVVVSDAVRALVPEASFTDLGEHTLKGLDRQEQLFQLDVPGLSQRFPPLRTATSRPNNLPALASRIFGREAELERLQAMLDANRLVTVTGAAGMGKTRLALEAASDSLSRFRFGVFFVDLAPVSDPALVLGEIAAAVGVDASGNGGLAEALSDGERLIVLDNLEQLIEAASRLSALLAGAAPLKMLVTSQVPLRIGGEVVMRLEPLETGDTAAAVELFAARARNADPTFDLDANRDDVIRLIELVDGVPLAIELAAASLNVLTPAQVIDRLGSGVLQTSRADAPDRHRSITSAVEWSYGLLTPSQQELLQTLSVFQGGATLEAIEAVAGRDPLDDLAELVDRSLVRPTVGQLGKRFDLLSSVRQYGLSRLADHGAIHRHSAYFTAVAAEAHSPLEGMGRGKWIAALNDDHDNLRITLERLIEEGDIERGYDLVGHAWRFFQTTGALGELELWLDRLFTADEAALPTLPRARALLARGALNYWRAEWQASAEAYEAAVAIAEEEGDRPLLLEALLGLTSAGGAAMGSGIVVGDPLEAAERVRELAIETDDQRALGYLEFLDAAARMMADPDRTPPGRDFFERMNTLQEKADNLMGVAHNLLLQSEVEIASGEYRYAQQVLLGAFDNAEEAGDTLALMWGVNRMAITAVTLGEPLLGARLAGASWAAQQRIGGAFPPPLLPVPEPRDIAVESAGADAEQAFEEGKDLGLLEAVAVARAYALGQ